MHEYNDFENFQKKIRNEHVNVSENDNKDLNNKNFDDTGLYGASISAPERP